MAESANLFDTVRENTKRLQELENFVKGDPAWNQPGLLTLLETIQTKQASHEWKIQLLLIMMVILLALCLALLVILAFRLRTGA